MRPLHRQGELFLNGRAVGKVGFEGFSGGWGFGQFTPAAGFSEFALVFGAWAMLIHEDDDRDRQSAESLAALREAEAIIDRLTAELVWDDAHDRIRLRQVTIDGPLIEWQQEVSSSV